MDEESSPLLPFSGNSKSSNSFKPIVAVLSAVAALAVLGVTMSSSHSPTIKMESLVSFTGDEMTVYQILAVDKKKYQIYCSGHSYAFCGDATCVDLDGMSAACGCITIPASKGGQFSIDSASLILLRSASYQSAAISVIYNN